MDALLRELLDELDAIGNENEEIYDTVCRERMSHPIFHIFIKPDPNYVAPDDYGLQQTSANLSVKHAVVTYANAARARAAEQGLDSFHDRLAAFQNGDIASSVDRNYFDDYFGWMDPSVFDVAGNVIQDGG